MLFLLEIVGGVKKKSVGYVHITHTFNNRKLAKLWYKFNCRTDHFVAFLWENSEPKADKE